MDLSWLLAPEMIVAAGGGAVAVVSSVVKTRELAKKVEGQELVIASLKSDEIGNLKTQVALLKNQVDHYDANYELVWRELRTLRQSITKTNSLLTLLAVRLGVDSTRLVFPELSEGEDGNGT